MPNCYYYDEQHNHCKCYVNENLNELLAENAKLRELLLRSYESFEEMYDRCDIDDPWRMETALEDMRVCMCELGVEVR